MAKYTLGIDCGTLSARALLVRVDDGFEAATEAMDYPHGVMDRELPCGRKLGADWALEDAQDYLDCLFTVVPAAVKAAGVAPEDIVGLGVDFTTCTVLPAKADGTPLSKLHPDEPNAYVKLWKHHAAQKYAERIEAAAHERRETFIRRYGGKVSSEALLPKVWQVLDESPELYAEADCFIEAGDWLVWQMTGRRVANAGMAGYKSYWSPTDGYPSEDFLKSLDPRLAGVFREKLDAPVVPSGSFAGRLTAEMAEKLGLCAGTAVTAAHLDAHVTLPAVKITKPGTMCMIMGTSCCHISLDSAETIVPGFCGVAADGSIPGYYALEAGQCCFGDHFAWFVNNCVPAAYEKEAAERGIGIHELLTEKMEKLRPGESGLIALDWWNGNRSMLVNPLLSGMILGMTLRTTPEEIYRALIEATAYGTRTIIEAYRKEGVEIRDVVATGGIARKNAVLMQIFSDVLNMPLRVGASRQSPALGTAIFAAAASGAAYSVDVAAEKMGALQTRSYTPIPENVKRYDELFAEYTLLHDYFGRGGNDVMRRLRRIAEQ